MRTGGASSRNKSGGRKKEKKKKKKMEKKKIIDWRGVSGGGQESPSVRWGGHCRKSVDALNVRKAVCHKYTSFPEDTQKTYNGAQEKNSKGGQEKLTLIGEPP